jgi:phasin
MQEMPKMGEMPEPMRQVVKSSIEQARRAFETFIAASQQAMSNIDTSSAPASHSMKMLNQKIAEFTKANAEANFELAMKLADAKEMQDVIELQNQHVRQQMDTFAQQLEELRRLTTDVVTETASKASTQMTPGGTSY